MEVRRIGLILEDEDAEFHLDISEDVSNICQRSKHAYGSKCSLVTNQ